MTRILWASRHPLDAAAEAALRERYPDCSVEHREILWPSGRNECGDLVRSLGEEFGVLAGIWPAQAVEAILDRAWSQLESLAVFSPVSVPVKEEDGGKVRSFRFERWARII